MKIRTEILQFYQYASRYLVVMKFLLDKAHRSAKYFIEDAAKKKYQTIRQLYTFIDSIAFHFLFTSSPRIVYPFPSRLTVGSYNSHRLAGKICLFLSNHLLSTTLPGWDSSFSTRTSWISLWKSYEWYIRWFA